MAQSKSEVKELFLHRIKEYESESFEWQGYKVGYFIQKNLTKSEDNDDVLFFYGADDYCIFGVCDGAGGHRNAAEASYIVGETILQYSRTHKPEEFQLIELIELANDNILKEYKGAYTTLSLCFIHGDMIRSYSVGDSEVQYTNQKAEVLYNNIPHSPVGHAVEAGIISQEESLDHQERNIVNNLMGDEVLRIEACTKFKLKKVHTVIVGSDGIFDNLTHDELSSILGRRSFSSKFKELSEYCIARDETWRKDDDVSFIILQQV